MIRRRTALIIVSAVAASSVIGGGAWALTRTVEPRVALASAASAFADTSSTSMTMGMSGTPEAIAALIDALQAPGKTPVVLKETDRAVFTELTSAQIVLAADRGENGKGNMQLAVRYAGSDLLDVRSIGNLLYAKLSTDNLVAKHPEATNALTDMKMVAAVIPGVDAILAGKWVSVDTTKLPSDYARKVEATTAQEQSSASKDAASNALASVITGADVTRDDADADHLMIRMTLKQLREALIPVVSAVSPTMKDKAAAALNVDTGDRAVTLDVRLRDGRLREVSLDLAQIPTNTHGPVRLALTLDQGARIDTPQGATALDVKKMAAGYVSLMLGRKAETD